MNIMHCISLAIFICGSMNADSVLERYFHHRMPANERDMQAGQLIFYFSGTLAKPNPVLSEESCERLNAHECIKQVSSVHLADVKATKQMIDQFNVEFDKQFKKEQVPYYVKMLSDTKNGVTFLIGYDPKKISFDHGTFVSIGARNAGFGFRFYNQDFANTLNKNSNTVPLLRVASATPVRLVIDCGHGGRDNGGVGINDVCEKDITLAVGKELAKLAKNAGYDVIMTRNSDKDLLVDARTSWINAKKSSDILVSIHANASSKKEVCGIETFCADNGLFNVWYSGLSARDARYVNECARSFNETSLQLARHIHRTTLDQVRKEHSWIADRGVKQTISQMLIGSTVPAATLVEVGFLTHPQEGLLLAHRKHQQHLAQGIFSGIQSFVNAQYVVA